MLLDGGKEQLLSIRVGSIPTKLTHFTVAHSCGWKLHADSVWTLFAVIPKVMSVGKEYG
jgi:hypothetical protein